MASLEELITNRSNIYQDYDFFFPRAHETLTSENVKNIVMSILAQETYQYSYTQRRNDNEN